MSGGTEFVRKQAARNLGALLCLARAYVAQTRPHICAQCGCLYQLPSLTNGRHCARCGIKETHHA